VGGRGRDEADGEGIQNSGTCIRTRRLLRRDGFADRPTHPPAPASGQYRGAISFRNGKLGQRSFQLPRPFRLCTPQNAYYSISRKKPSPGTSRILLAESLAKRRRFAWGGFSAAAPRHAGLLLFDSRGTAYGEPALETEGASSLQPRLSAGDGWETTLRKMGGRRGSRNFLLLCSQRAIEGLGSRVVAGTSWIWTLRNNNGGAPKSEFEGFTNKGNCVL